MKRFLLSTFLFAIAFVMHADSLDNSAKLEFYVVDEVGKALPGIGVRVYNEDVQLISGNTDNNGIVELTVPAEYGKTYTYEVSNSMYAKNSGTFELDSSTKKLNVSYETYHRVSITVNGWYEDQIGRDYANVRLISAEKGVLDSKLSLSADNSEVSFVVPDGDYNGIVVSYSYKDDGKSYAFFRMKPADAPLEFDMLKCLPVEVKNGNEKVSFHINPIVDGKAFEHPENETPIKLYPGTYQLSAEIKGLSDSFSDAYYCHEIAVDNDAVSLSVSSSDFHRVKFVSSNADELAGGTFYYKNIRSLNAGWFSADMYSPDNVYSGNFEYAVNRICKYGTDYDLPYPICGDFSANEEDVSIPLDLSSYHFFIIDLNGWDLARDVTFVNDKGEKVDFYELESEDELCMPIGKYTVTGSVYKYGESESYEATGRLEITPESSDYVKIIWDDEVGIGTVVAADDMSVKMESDGFRVLASGGASVKVELYDLSGRLLKEYLVEDGDIVPTDSLNKGVYVARLSSKASVSTVKLTVR